MCKHLENDTVLPLRFDNKDAYNTASAYVYNSIDALHFMFISSS